MFLTEWSLFMADPSLSAGERGVWGRERHRDPTLVISAGMGGGGKEETSDLGVSGLETWLLNFHPLSPGTDR